MGYQVYRVGERWGGYGVPAVCDHPDCNEEIDRGMSHACGSEPFSEYGCDRYFCEKHIDAYYVDHSGEITEECEEYTRKCDDNDDDCVCGMVQLCVKCGDSLPPFPYKPEHPDWIKHLLTDESWEEWRKENPDKVKKLLT